MFPFTLQQLLILQTIATEKNFTKAADLLYLSQPSVSKHIQRLEKNLNVNLIRREKNKIFLTAHGKILLQYSERIVYLSQECCRVFIDFKKNERSTFTIGVTPTIEKYLLPKAMELFVKTYPQIDLKIERNSIRRITRKIRNSKIELGLVNPQILNEFQKQGFIQPFINDEIRLIVPKSHFLVSKGFFNPKDLYSLHFITLNSNLKFRKLMDDSLLQNQIETNRFKIILELNSIESVQIAVSLGLGVAFLFSSMIEKERKLKTIQILKIESITQKQPFSILSHSKASQAKVFQFFSLELWKPKENLEN